MKKIILLFAVFIFSIVTFGCSKSEDLGMTFEEFRVKYNENVRRENLPSEYLIRLENTKYSKSNDIECYSIDLPNEITTMVFLTKKQPSQIIDTVAVIDCATEDEKSIARYKRVAVLLYLYSLVASNFDDKWKDINYTSSQGAKLVDGDTYVKGNYAFKMVIIDDNHLSFCIKNKK